MTQADYDIHRCSRHCSASGRELVPGETFFSVLLRSGANLERRDYAAEAWQEPPADAVGWWKSIVPERDATKRHMAPSDVLLEYFASLTDCPDQADVQYVLALLMVRKRILRLEESRVDADGRESLILYAPRDESTHEVSAVLPDEARLNEIQNQLSQLLFAPRDVMEIAMHNDCHRSDSQGRASGVRAALVVLGLTICSGASCRNLADQYAVPEPRTLQPGATLEAVTEVVNANSSRIQSLTATDCSLSTPMIPVALRTSIALIVRGDFACGPKPAVSPARKSTWEATTSCFGFGCDAINRQPCTFADTISLSIAPRQVIPVEPEWLIEALGVTWFSPSEQHTGPAAVGGGRLRINSLRPTSQGACTKVTVVDDAKGWVLEQHLYDPRGERIASALTSDHRRDPVNNVVLPHLIEIQWPATQVNLKIRVPASHVNILDPNTPTLWTLPEYPGWTNVDLGNPPIPGAVSSQPGQVAPPQQQGWNGLRQ